MPVIVDSVKSQNAGEFRESPQKLHLAHDDRIPTSWKLCFLVGTATERSFTESLACESETCGREKLRKSGLSVGGFMQLVFGTAHSGATVGDVWDLLNFTNARMRAQMFTCHVGRK